MKWTPEYLNEFVDTLPFVKNSTHNVFVLASRGQREFIKDIPFVESSKRHPYEIHNISMSKFVSIGRSPPSWNQSPQYLYYFGPLDWFPKNLQNDLPDLDKFTINYSSSQFSHKFETNMSSTTSIWMGVPKGYQK